MSGVDKVIKSLYNIHPEPLAGYKFQVFIQNVKLGFTKISNFEEYIETEGIVEGGVNGYVHSLLKPVSSEKTLVLERGVGSRGTVANMLAKLKVGRHFPFDVLIIVGSRDGDIKHIYMVHGATVKSWRMSDLNAMDSSVLIESFELVYEELDKVDTSIVKGINMGLEGMGISPF